MRFMKNSSRLDPVMARNFTRSSSGVRLSAASLSTRLLKRSQVSSRLKYSCGEDRSGPVSAAAIPALGLLDDNSRRRQFSGLCRYGAPSRP